jgi:DNA-binding NarL/FixJ family response regulator
MGEPTPLALLLSDDLLDGSRVTATARAIGFEVRQRRSADALIATVRDLVPSCVLVDLHNPGLDVPALVRELRSLSPRPRLVGYGSHVDAARLRAARQGGCDEVMPRSQFFEALESRLSEWLGGHNKTDPGT